MRRMRDASMHENACWGNVCAVAGRGRGYIVSVCFFARRETYTGRDDHRVHRWGAKREEQFLLELNGCFEKGQRGHEVELAQQKGAAC